MNKSNQKINSGFTLVEILLYLSLFAVVVLGSVAFIHTMLETNIKTKTILAADTEANHVLSIITQSIRDSATVLSPSKGNENSILAIQTFNEQYPSIVFGIINNALVVSEIGQSTTTLTSNKIKISNLKFTNIGTINGKDSIKISFTVNTQGESGRQEYNYEKTYEATASARN